MQEGEIVQPMFEASPTRSFRFIDALQPGCGQAQRVATAALTMILAASPAWSARLSVADLPDRLAAELASGAVQAQMTDGTISSYFSHEHVSAYAFSRGGDPFALVQYNAIVGSQYAHTSSDPIALSGLVFVEAPFVAGGSNEFVIHFDQITSDPNLNFSFLFSDNQPQARLLLTSEAITAGFGSYHLPVTPNGGNPNPTGTMTWDGSSFPHICVECGFDAQFSLLNLDYSGGRLRFDLDDPRTLLFHGDVSNPFSPEEWALDVYAAAVDIDGDGVLNESDNCLWHENPGQIDVDNDGFGNACDGDFNDDCFVNFADLAELRAAFFSNDPEYDLDGSGIVAFLDSLVFRGLLFQPPGPSGVPNICSP